MGTYSSKIGYIPDSHQQILDRLATGVNEQFGTDYTGQSLIGTNFYKAFYGLIQEVQNNDINYSETLEKFKDYIDISQEQIAIASVSNEGAVNLFNANGFDVSDDKTTLETKGILKRAIGYRGKATQDNSILIASLMQKSVTAGMFTAGSGDPTYDVVENAVLSDGNSVEYTWTVEKPISLHWIIDIKISKSNLHQIPNDNVIAQTFVNNYNAIYSLGKDVEPDAYMDISRDAPYAGFIKPTWSLSSGGVYSNDIKVSQYNELYDITSVTINILEG